MSKKTELLKQAASRREEARSRRALARLISGRRPDRQLEQQAHQLEVEAERLEKETDLLPPEDERRRPRRRDG
jgi:hypothetical protein